MATRRHSVTAIVIAIATTFTVGSIAPASAAVERSETSLSTAQDRAYLPTVLLGRVGTSDTKYSVRVPKAGKYKVWFQINYPNGRVRLNSSIDGRKLPTVTAITPSGPQLFHLSAYSVNINVRRAGVHDFVLRASRIPGNAGIRADLVDADVPEIS